MHEYHASLAAARKRIAEERDRNRQLRSAMVPAQRDDTPKPMEASSTNETLLTNRLDHALALNCTQGRLVRRFRRRLARARRRIARLEGRIDQMEESLSGADGAMAGSWITATPDRKPPVQSNEGVRAGIVDSRDDIDIAEPVARQPAPRQADPGDGRPATAFFPSKSTQRLAQSQAQRRDRVTASPPRSSSTSDDAKEYQPTVVDAPRAQRLETIRWPRNRGLFTFVKRFAFLSRLSRGQVALLTVPPVMFLTAASIVFLPIAAPVSARPSFPHNLPNSL
ncbi:MAG: hypothetical protein H0W83_05840 [Planctomycetes bacterium]|nr:hypothetical protein [Planctomycetota bacterium]